MQRGLQLKKAGNRLMEVIGGRSVHPVNVRVGGFYRAPPRRDLRALAGELERALQAALDTLRWVATFSFPDFDHDYVFVSLRHPTDYPITEGRIVSGRGLDISPGQYDGHFVEEQVLRRGAAADRGLRAAGSAVRAGAAAGGGGFGCTEAPRGLLYHRYRLASDGDHHGREDRPADLAEPAGDRGRPAGLRRQPAGPAARPADLGMQQAVRSYDPCISCAAQARHRVPVRRRLRRAAARAAAAPRHTHAFSVADVIELARALGRQPGRLIGYGIEGAEFGAGTGLTPQAARGVDAVVARLTGELTSAPGADTGRW